jgi:hypothetical protein
MKKAISVEPKRREFEDIVAVPYRPARQNATRSTNLVRTFWRLETSPFFPIGPVKRQKTDIIMSHPITIAGHVHDKNHTVAACEQAAEISAFSSFGRRSSIV